MLPARLARLARGFAIILMRKLFLATAAAPASAITATISATTAASAAGTARAAGFGLGPRFVNFQIASAEILAIESGDGFGGFVVILHFNETEPASPAGFAVCGNVDASELAKRLEERAQVCGGGLKAHVAYKQVLHTGSLLSDPRAPRKKDTQVPADFACPSRLQNVMGLPGAKHAQGGNQMPKNSKSGSLIVTRMDAVVAALDRAEWATARTAAH